MKKLLNVESAPRPHWVGDGFPVRSLFSYDRQTQVHSPFLLLDYAGPMQFQPTARARGVGVHPHRGFETVTVVYQGEVEHRDSSGGGGKIGPGDVQWMTAASGILHDEFHSEEFTRDGGTLEMVQLWVNLPAKHKLAPAGYQSILSKDIPILDLDSAEHVAGAGTLRVIAGELGGRTGPARTFTPMDVWDVHINQGSTVRLPSAEGRTLTLAVLHGTVLVNGNDVVRETQKATFERAGQDVLIEANSDAHLLVLSGEPIDEPVVGYGPFVMNSEAEIRQAIEDFNRGRLGRKIA